MAKPAKRLQNAGLDLDQEVSEEERYYLEKTKIDDLLKELGTFLNFDDLMEIKQHINKLSREGKSLPARLLHREQRRAELKQKYLRKTNPLSNYVVE